MEYSGCFGDYHVFVWSSTYTEEEPPEGLPCECGQVFYESERLAPEGVTINRKASITPEVL